MKYFSLFTGIGGFEYGIEKATDKEWECIGYSEIDKWAKAIYKFNYPEDKNFGDATKIVSDKIPDFDLVVAGFPCQAFSIAGRRKGFQDTRGTLFFEICRVCEDKRPRYILLENVKGLLSHEDGKTFQTILGALSDIGYLLQWEVLNSKNFGVPQNRDRVFIIGYLGKGSVPQVFPIEEGDSKPQEIQPETGRQRQGVQGKVPKARRNSTGVKGRGQRVRRLGGLYGEHQAGSIYDPRGISPILDTAQGGNREPLITSAITTENAHSFGKNVTKNQVNDILSETGKIRRLTPIECERLQGFPDDWTRWGIIDKKKVKISDSQRYKCLGNAVTVNVIEIIMAKLMRATDG